jgi:nucleolar protein 14
MAGSQLKQLKAALKENGLTGQTNVKRKKTTKKAPSDSRRDEREEVISKIRQQFNPFEIKVNRTKHDTDDKFKKGAQGKPGISKQIGEDARKAAWEAKKLTKNRNGLIKDRRFGERDSTLTPEEKMLERFTRERQTQAGGSRKGLYNLDESDEENEPFGEGLTHYGQSLSMTDDFQENDLNGGESDEEFMRPKKRVLEEAGDRLEQDEGEEGAVPRKKTKAEVMQEVIAKSKFHKQQRQLLKEQNAEKILDLDDDFADVMKELGSVKKVKPAPFADTTKDPSIVNYEQSVRELNMDRRAAPADRTKTEEEIRVARVAKMRELEEARERRMRGEDDTQDQDRGADDLGDEFWEQNSADEAEGFAIDDNESDVKVEESESEDEGRPKTAKPVAVICPESHEQFLDILEQVPFAETINHTNKILETYAARLQAGNKEKLSIFTVILFQHVLYLSESSLVNEDKFTEIQEGLITIIKKLTEKYSTDLTEALRDKIEEIHERIQETVKGNEEFPRVSDLTFFALVGMMYSTSDHYHLVVTPASIVMGEALEQVKFTSLNSLFGGIFIAEVFLTYQRISKRYIPEVTFFLQKALLSLLPSDITNEELSTRPDGRFPLPSTISASKDHTLRLSDIDNEEFSDLDKVQIFEKTLEVLELALDTWKEKTALLEISQPFIIILESALEKFPDFKPLSQLSLKFTRLLKFAKDERVPVTLQSHKKLAIASYAPKFEENYNPEKKSYDHDRQRQEVNKMKALIKQERKITIREIRKDTRFEARQQIKEKKESHDSYHSKISKILNTINTVEGAEKNEYEREKKQRKGKK